MSIIAVIWIHARSGSGYDDWNFPYWIIVRDLINFPVALFLFISAYFVNTSRLDEPWVWIKGRITRLLIPFLVWSTLYGVILSASTTSISLVEWVLRVSSGLTAPHLYFIVVLIQLTLLTPLIARAIGTRWIWAIYAITPAYLLALYAFAFATGNLPPLYNYPFAAWILFYVLGMHIRAKGLPKCFTPAVTVAFACFALALSVVESFGLLDVGMPDSFASSQLKLSSVAYSVAIIALAVVWRRRLASSAMSRLGEESYGVYYAHLLWLFVINATVDVVVGGGTPRVLFAVQSIQVVGALILSLATVWMARRIVGHKYASRYLGF